MKKYITNTIKYTKKVQKYKNVQINRKSVHTHTDSRVQYGSAGGRVCVCTYNFAIYLYIFVFGCIFLDF